MQGHKNSVPQIVQGTIQGIFLNAPDSARHCNFGASDGALHNYFGTPDNASRKRGLPEIFLFSSSILGRVQLFKSPTSFPCTPNMKTYSRKGSSQEPNFPKVPPSSKIFERNTIVEKGYARTRI